MEAIANNNHWGSRHHRSAVLAAVFFVVLGRCTSIDAQVLTIRSRDSEQLVTHSLQDATQAFSSVRWDIQNAALRDGCIVRWTAEPFVHESDSGVQADCEILLSLDRGSRPANWRVTIPRDATNVDGGKKLATVSMLSTGRGNAQVELQVLFRHPRVSSLAAGDYQTTLTGTITGL